MGAHEWIKSADACSSRQGLGPSAAAAKCFPTTAVLQVDETLAPLQAVMEWAAEGNPPGQRVAHILSIPAAAAESSLEDARNMLLPLLSQLAFDEHPDVKLATAEVLGPLGETRRGCEERGGVLRLRATRPTLAVPPCPPIPALLARPHPGSKRSGGC